MSQYLIEQIEQTPNIEVRTNTVIVEALGDIASGAAGAAQQRNPCDRLRAGQVRCSFSLAQCRTREWLEGVVVRDAHGFIKTGPALAESGSRPRYWPLDRDPYLLEASVPGIFAAGDVRMGSVKRVASGVGEGAMVVSFVHQHLAGVMNQLQSAIEDLRQIAAFADLPDDQIVWLAERASFRDLAAGDIVIAEGKAGRKHARHCGR